MEKIIREILKGDWYLCLSLSEKGRKSPEKLKSAIEKLNDTELIKLGQIYKRFPFGCDITEIVVDVVSDRQSLTEIKGGFRILDRLGLPVHVCSYAISDIAERERKTPYQIMKELRNLTKMPIDIDHFGKYGPMRYPEEIVKCPADCYRLGKPFNGCPRGRIHKRVIEKEKRYIDEREKWFEICESVSVSLMSFQKNTSHSAPPEETVQVIKEIKKHGKGVGAIICVGDGKEELIRGLKACMEYKIDEIVIEGGPYNRTDNRKRSFAEAIVMARIVSEGKVIATNGQYENELRFGLKCGLNSVISGFPGNHHAYMSGYNPGEATIDKFGLPKIFEIINEEVETSPFPIPSDRKTAEIIAKSAKFLGEKNIYPSKKIGKIPIGDAHWFLLIKSPLAKKIKLRKTFEDFIREIKKRKVETLGILGGRFICWKIAEEIYPFVKKILISDKDTEIEKITVKHLKNVFGEKIEGCNGDDKLCAKHSQLTVLASFIPSLINRFKNQSGIITLED